jgi:hypothetical protein
MVSQTCSAGDLILLTEHVGVKRPKGTLHAVIVISGLKSFVEFWQTTPSKPIECLDDVQRADIV